MTDETEKELILIVDDVQQNIQVLGSILRKNGYNIAATTNGSQVFDMLKDVTPDLILLDIMMPEMDGYEVCTKLQQSPRFSEIPVIFLTARTQTEDIVKGLQAGAVDYVTKPINAPVLLARVKAQLQISSQKKALIQVNMEKDRFVSILSHDLRSPLSSIISCLKLIRNAREEKDDAEVTELIDEMEKISKGTFVLLENLLEWSRLQKEGSLIRMEQFNMSVLLVSIVSFYQDLARLKGLTFSLEIPEAAHIVSDKNHISTIVRNLISNAIKFTSAGGTIGLKLETGKTHFIITVSDTGIGMDETVRANLFSGEKKLSRQGTAGESGSGFGLNLCMDLVRKHGGTLDVESVTGKGSKFTITIPCTQNPQS